MDFSDILSDEFSFTHITVKYKWDKISFLVFLAKIVLCTFLRLFCVPNKIKYYKKVLIQGLRAAMTGNIQSNKIEHIQVFANEMGGKSCIFTVWTKNKFFMFANPWSEPILCIFFSIVLFNLFFSPKKNILWNENGY